MIFPLLQEVYPNGGTNLGPLMSLLSLLGIALGLVAGIVVSAFGHRRLLILALSLSAVLSAAQALLPSLPVLLGLRLLETCRTSSSTSPRRL